MKLLKQLLLPLLVLLSTSVNAQDKNWEFGLLFGQSWSPDIDSSINEQSIELDSGTNIGFSFSWQDSPNGQGQILVNTVSYDFVSDTDQTQQSLDVTYAHFNGVALFKQESYITTVSIGIGGANFDSGFNNELYASATVSVGTKYQISDNLSVFTEIRGYATLVDEEDNLFCQGEVCHGQFENSLWLDANISIGLSFKF